MNIKNSKSNFILMLSGLCLIVLAFILFFSPFESDKSNFLLISVVFLSVGLLEILAFAQNPRWYFRPGWILQQSFFLIFFGILLLFSDGIEFETDLLLFSFLAFFSATAQLSCSIQLHALEIRRWWWISVFGFVQILFGAFFLIDPFSSFMNLFSSIAVYLFVSGFILMLEPLVYLSKPFKRS